MFPPPPKAQDSDAPIRATDSDASLARLSAVQKGYLSDPFVHLFVPRAHLQPSRPPLINIGTYVRSASMDRLIIAWMNTCKSYGRQCQIVSLGAGSDTRFWRLANDGHKESIAKYIEFDFQEITTKKAMAIKKNKELSTFLGEPGQISLANGGTSLRSPIYNLLAADMRKPPSTTLAPLLTDPYEDFAPLLDSNVPTLLLFECVLAYMQPGESYSLIAWFTDYFRDSAPLGAIVYEMFGLEDAFGRVMKSNLKARNVEFPGAEPYSTQDSLPRRFTEHGYQLSEAVTLKEIRNTLVPIEELERISQLEMLDEIEELDLVLAHYAITWGAIWPSGDDDVPSKWTGWDMSWNAVK